MVLDISRKQKPIPPKAKYLLAQIPDGFTDDGCSNSPDSLFGFDFKWACRIHDYRYCSRCHDPRYMRNADKVDADKELRRNIRSTVPRRWFWIPWVYQFAVWRYGGLGSYDSCFNNKDELCRHNIAYIDNKANS